MRRTGLYLFLILSLLGTDLRAQNKSVSILTLGDSLTWGYSNTGDTPGGYRDPLYSMLLGAGVSTTYVGVGTGNSSTLLTSVGQSANDGFNGYTVNQIDANLAANVQPNTSVSNMGGNWLTSPGQKANIVLLMAGTNDITLSDPNLTASQIGAQITSNIQNLIEDVRTNEPHATILVASPPPVILFPNWTADSTELSNDLSTLISTSYQTKNVYFVNMDTALNQYGYYAWEDGIHLNESGYNQMASTWYNAIMTDYNFNAAAAPEPSTWALLAGGVVALVAWRQVRRA